MKSLVNVPALFSRTAKCPLKRLLAKEGSKTVADRSANQGIALFWRKRILAWKSGRPSVIVDASGNWIPNGTASLIRR
jgi:hypothetical protein